ncbi:serine hydrolase domain-containing protein [Arthrobacter sp. lap29]|uniref:serine hydrolase domain-containing protein n=1 Tax=Arthrobacter sp. lap29 TaxID=3056122 RepID=UPI0028F72CCE|nr:serine hydrolase domain-containing protein [Arthrobacter sp. lap29]
MSPSHPHFATELRSRLQRLLEASVRDGVAPAVACAVVLHQGSGNDSGGAGGIELPVLTAGQATRGTFFDLASVTKLFTTATVLALVNDGRLALDAPIGRHLRAYAAGEKSTVTLRHLLTHTSGLPAQWRGWHTAISDGNGFQRKELIADLLTTPLTAPPGTRYEYSCAGFNTIMVLAERVTKTPWAQLVKERVLYQLPTHGITGSPRIEQCAPTEYQPELGRGLVRGIVHDEAAWSLAGLSGNAGMFATADGLRVFGSALLNGLPGILSPGLAAEMWRDQLPGILAEHFKVAGPGFGQGLGLRINEQPWMGAAGTQARGHTGFTGTSLLVDQEAGLLISLLSNRVNPSRDGSDATVLRQAVSELVYSFAQ